MIRVIDGKRYNTDTAIRIAVWSNGRFVDDFHYESEDLYRTIKGAWFLHVEGGAFSAYSETAPGGRTGYGRSIIPMTGDEARRWLEQRDEVKAIDEYFGDDIEDA